MSDNDFEPISFGTAVVKVEIRVLSEKGGDDARDDDGSAAVGGHSSAAVTPSELGALALAFGCV
jgi:hypothetical protein